MRFLLHIVFIACSFSLATAQEEGMDPPATVFKKYAMFYEVDDNYLTFKTQQQDENLFEAQLIYLTPQRIQEEEQDLKEISKGQELEARGWQKLSRYIKELYWIKGISLRESMHLHLALGIGGNFQDFAKTETYSKELKILEMKRQEILKDPSSSDEGIEAGFMSYCFTVHQKELIQLCFNRLDMLGKTIDHLLIYRQSKQLPVETLNNLKERLQKLYQLKDDCQQVGSFGIIWKRAFDEFIEFYGHQALEYDFIESFNKGRIIKFHLIP